MAGKSTLQLFKPIEDLGLSGAVYMTDQSDTKIIYTDFQSGTTFTLEGEGFNVKHGKITAGTIDHMMARDDAGKPLMEFSDFEISAKKLPQTVPQALLGGLMQEILEESNIIIGSKKADQLTAGSGGDVIKAGGGADEVDGGQGKDELWGGGGPDTFVFSTGYGKDRIMDFDADGSDGSQDLLDANYGDIVSKKNVAGDTVIDFGNGDVLTLVDIKPKDIDASDFVA